MTRDERQRLGDILEAANAVLGHARRARADGNVDDPLFHDALLYQFVVIGEAVKHLSHETRERGPDVPWSEVAALRDLIAHEYFRISSERILEIVDRDVPTLVTTVERLLAD